jgi:hypothetical protein
MRIDRSWTAPVLALTLALAAQMARADIDGDLFAGHQVATSETLSELRGAFVGFSGAQRLELSFGLEQAVFINNELVVITRLTMPVVNQFAGARLNTNAALTTPLTATSVDQVSVSSVQHAGGQISLVQVGPGNGAALINSQLPSGVVNVIQNSLDNQTIRQTTALQMTANSLGLVRMINLHSILQQQIAASVR